MIDLRELPSHWPAAVRESTEAARGIRDNPFLLKLIEGELIGSVDGVLERTVHEYVRRHLGEEALIKFRTTDYSTQAAAIAQQANGPGWKASPLSVGITLSRDLQQQYSVAPHLRLISDAVVDAFSGRGPKNVLISVPPRHGKSELAGRRTLEWFFANYPGLPAIYVSSTDELATTMGRLCRNDLQLHEDRFGFSLAEDSSAAGRFNTSIEGGTLVATGVQGQVVGRGAALMIIDDVFKNSEQGNSSTYRDMIWSLWTTALQSRLQSGAVLVVIGTRWHTADLHGRLISGWGDAQPLDARVIRIPAIAEVDDDELGRCAGESLPFGPVRVPGFGYTLEELLARKATTGAEEFATVYQQTPADELSAGKAYKFDAARHVQMVAFDPALQITAALDFNVNPMSCVLMHAVEQRPDLRMILTSTRLWTVDVFDEMCLSDSTTFDMATELVERLRRLAGGQRIRLKVTGDASGNQRRSSSGTHVPETDWSIFREIMAKHSGFISVTYDVRSSNPGVRERVAKVNSFLQPAGGDVLFRISPCCRSLIRDLEKVTWAKDANGNTRDTLNKKDEKLTHMSDALGYGCWIIGKGEYYGEMPGTVF